MNILAIKIGPQQIMGNGAVDTGYRAIIAVTRITAKLQTTVYFGNSLYMIHNEVGQLDAVQGYQFFLNQWLNRPMTWGQLAEVPPNPLVSTRRFMLAPPMPPLPPTSEGTMSLLSSGFDPLRGYWLEFAGNFFLTSTIFRNFNGVTRDGC